MIYIGKLGDVYQCTPSDFKSELKEPKEHNIGIRNSGFWLAMTKMLCLGERVN